MIYADEQQKLTGDTAVVERVLEYIRGIAEVKAYALTGRYNDRLESVIDENVNANIDMELKLLPLMLAQNAAGKLIDVGVAALSLALYTGGRMELTPQRHDIHAEHIRFSYGEKPILTDVTLDIPERTTTAVVGPSGGGKSTLCQLLARFWDVDAGAVTLGGHDVREYDMDSLMRNFSFVFQNVFLFHDTVANNIRFGCPGAPMEQVVAAAKKARCHDFIMKLPQGYETVLGEAGSTLSGGERQRLSIARARHHSRRGHGQRRPGERKGADGGRRCADAQQNGHPDRAPAEDRAQCRSDPRGGQGADRPARHARDADGARWTLPPLHQRPHAGRGLEAVAKLEACSIDKRVCAPYNEGVWKNIKL